MSNWDDIDDGSGSGFKFIKTADVIDALAILFEPSDFNAGVETDYGIEDQAIGRLTIFNNVDMLNGKEPPIEYEAAVLKKTLASNVKRNEKLGKLERPVLGQVVMQKNKDPKKYDYPVIRPVDDSIAEKVVAYGKKRDEQANAMPDWAS